MSIIVFLSLLVVAIIISVMGVVDKEELGWSVIAAPLWFAAAFLSMGLESKQVIAYESENGLVFVEHAVALGGWPLALILAGIGTMFLALVMMRVLDYYRSMG